ncbi:MAG: GIY-YIG nuclease family protein [Chthoniobacterales bacterium]|nr:GIY-YIG nuclease family protein [Chthoniobacterales bacterium]
MRAADASVRVPAAPGVHAWYHQNQPVYVGMSTNLNQRLVETHLSTRASMYFSAFRRNVAERLGFGAPRDIKSKVRVLSAKELDAVTEWIRDCQFSWIECASAEEAKVLEASLKREYKPPLTKR